MSTENPRIVRGFQIASALSMVFIKSPPYDTLQLQPASCIERKERGLLYFTMIEQSYTLAHTAWNCKYHIVFAPKYRRKVFYGQIRSDVKDIIKQLCFQKEVELLEGELCPDHVHILVAIPPKLSVSSFVGYLKGKSSLMIYEKYGNMKFKYRNRQFWCRGYYVDTTGKNTKKIKEYIENQLKRDEEAEQLTLEGLDPFTGKKR